MAMVINSNIASLTSQRHLSNSRNDMEVAMERMSSGSRINSSMDDAAGLAISNRMTSQIDGLNQAIRNANDAISLAQTAEATLDSHSDILQRMRVLAVQAANDTYSTLDRQTLNNEIVQLKEELNRSVTVATFNGQKILDGTNDSFTFQVGHVASDTVTIALTDMRGAEIGTRSWADKTGVVAPTSVGDPDSKAGTIEVPAVVDAVEKDTYQLSGQVTTGGSVSFEINGTRYTESFDTSHAKTMDNLAASINANEASFIAARNGDNLEVNALTASNVQQPVGEISGELNSNSEITMSKTDSVVGKVAVTAVQEVDTYTITGTAAANGNISFTINGNTYNSQFATDHATTLTNLKTAINTGETDLTASISSGKLVLTANAGSDTQMPTGVVGGVVDSTATPVVSISGSKADTTAGVGAVSAEREQDTYSVTPTMDVGGYIDFKLNGNTYHQKFDQSHANSMDKLVATINSTDSAVTAARVGNDIVITAASASATQMTGATATGQADNASALTAAHLNTVEGAAAAPIEKDTYEMQTQVAAGGHVSFSINGNSYSQSFDTDHRTTMDKLVTQINVGETGLIASRDGDNMVITAAQAADTQMTAGTIGGQKDTSAVVAVTKADTTAGTASHAGQNEVDTYDIGGTIDSSSTMSVTFNGKKYEIGGTTDANATPPVVGVTWDTDEATTLAALATAIDGDADVSAAITGGDLVITAAAKSSTQLTAAVFSGTYDGSASVSATHTNTTAGIATGASVAEVDTYSLASNVAAGGSIEMTYNGETYNQAFDSSHTNTLDLLVANINATDSSVTASRSGDKLVMTAAAASTTQMTPATFKVYANDSAEVSASQVNSVVGHTAVAAIEGSAAINAFDFNSINLDVGDRVSLTVNGNTYIQEFITDKEATLNSLGALVVNGEPSYEAKALVNGKLEFTGQANGTAIENGVMKIETGVVHAADSVDDIIITDSASAKHSLTTIDNALEMMAEFRSRMGAMSNRMYHTVSNLMSVSENTSAARSRIQDADFALESANLAKSQVLQQAGTAMLAQANASTKDILSLLK